jgi:hypothetical protein
MVSGTRPRVPITHPTPQLRSVEASMVEFFTLVLLAVGSWVTVKDHLG